MTYENKPYDNKPDAYPSAPPPSYNATYDESAYLERIHYYLMPFNSKKQYNYLNTNVIER